MFLTLLTRMSSKPLSVGISLFLKIIKVLILFFTFKSQVLMLYFQTLANVTDSLKSSTGFVNSAKQ